jgi:hypothetical protein
VNKNNIRSVFCSAFATITLLLGQTAAYAATSTKPATSSVNSNSNTLKVSPLRSDITLKAGTSGKVTTLITNLTSSSVQLKPIENDFVAGDEKGTPALILDENSYAPSHSLKRFMTPLSNITVAAGATQSVDVNIVVPKSAQAGGYYGAIRFAPAGGSSNQSVNLNASVASLILLTVPGPVTESLTMTNFDIRQNGGSATNFRSPDNLSVLIRFENKGNIQEGPFGQIYVQKGKKTLYTSNFNKESPQQQVLPDSARRWEVPLKNFGKFGKYTVGATLGYGSKGQTINIEKTVWIVPTSYIFTGLGILAFLIIVGVGSFIFLRSYKRKILQSSRRRY